MHLLWLGVGGVVALGGVIALGAGGGVGRRGRRTLLVEQLPLVGPHELQRHLLRRVQRLGRRPARPSLDRHGGHASHRPPRVPLRRLHPAAVSGCRGQGGAGRRLEWESAAGNPHSAQRRVKVARAVDMCIPLGGMPAGGQQRVTGSMSGSGGTPRCEPQLAVNPNPLGRGSCSRATHRLVLWAYGLRWASRV